MIVIVNGWDMACDIELDLGRFPDLTICLLGVLLIQLLVKLSLVVGPVFHVVYRV